VTAYEKVQPGERSYEGLVERLAARGRT
jgi:hypothetical protein